MKSRKAGFTLLELLVVLAIIGILSTVIIASLSRARMKARDAQRMSDIKQINNAIQLYILTNNTAPRFDACPTASCGSTDRDTFQPWTELATKLQPYIRPLPKDPCGTRCDDASNNKFFTYKYESPGTLLLNVLSPTEYQISAMSLEVTLQPFGVSTVTSFTGFGSQ